MRTLFVRATATTGISDSGLAVPMADSIGNSDVIPQSVPLSDSICQTDAIPLVRTEPYHRCLWIRPIGQHS
jgi:hypothetical protein